MPFPESVVLTGLTELMSPVLVAVTTVLLALVIVTAAKVFGLAFFGNVNVDGADKTHTGGVAEADGDAPGYGEGEVEGDGSGSTVGFGDGPTVGAGDASPSGDGDGDVSGDVLGDGEGSAPSIGLALGLPDTTVEGLELRVILEIALSGKISLPMVTSPEPERFMELGGQQSLFSSNPI